MAANTSPIFSLSGRFSSVGVTAANTSSQGGGTVGTDIFLAFTPGANGSFVREARWVLSESTIATASTGTVGRIFMSTVGTGSTTSSNTYLLAEVALVSQTPSSTLAGVPVVVPLNIIVPSNYFILSTNHAAPAANTKWNLHVIGGDY